jgi:uncharacterized membrane protein YfcA
MTVPDVIILFGAALIAGALNSVAGGGSFISFPALVSTGVPYINANTTNTVALWPGSVASVGAYREELKAQRSNLLMLILVSLLGGFVGAKLLLGTPQTTFALLLPFLMLFATLLFSFGKSATSALRAGIAKRELPAHYITIGVVAIQFVISVYGGFFGGGIGIMMLAVLALWGMENIHMMNALKTLLASCINGVAVVTFVIAGAVYWPEAVLMIVAAIVGGYGGAYYARQIDPKIVRRFVIVVGTVMTVYFFVRTYGPH